MPDRGCSPCPGSPSCIGVGWRSRIVGGKSPGGGKLNQSLRWGRRWQLELSCNLALSRDKVDHLRFCWGLLGCFFLDLSSSHTLGSQGADISNCNAFLLASISGLLASLLRHLLLSLPTDIISRVLLVKFGLRLDSIGTLALAFASRVLGPTFGGVNSSNSPSPGIILGLEV